MKKSRIEITLLSDLCCYSGEAYNSTVDIDCVYDKYGIPYIPAKRIKGCIREAALELKEIGNLNEEEYNAMFGKEGNSPSIFTISNARIKDYDEIVEDIKSFNKNGLCEQQKVLNLYTYTRTQTKINESSGSAEDNSLRTMRVVKKGLVFYADLEFNDKEDKYFIKFEQAVKMVKHMGLSRTRGLGLVDLKVDDTNVVNIKYQEELKGEKELKEKNRRISYVVKLKSPVICKSPTGNQAITEDYISGSKILGFIASNIGNNYEYVRNNIIVSNAYIVHETKINNETVYERCLPARKSLYKEKNKKYNENGELNLLDMLYFSKNNYSINDSVRTSQKTSANIDYLSETNRVKTVETEISYHHKRPNNKSLGHVINNVEDGNGEFYQLASICEGQIFKGYIYTNDEYVKMISNAFSKTKQIRIGYGKNSEFGLVEIDLGKEEEYTFVNFEDGDSEKDFEVLLLSDVILYNDYGMLVADQETFKKYLENYFNIKDCNIKNSYLSYSSIGGYNVKWGTRKETFTALSKGSIIRFKGKIKFDAEKSYFIGERISEGYGEIRIKEVTIELDKVTVYKDYQNGNAADTKESETINSEIIKLLLEKELHKEIEVLVREKVKELDLSEKSKPAISKLRLLYKTQDNFSGVKKQIENMKAAKSECCKLIGIEENKSKNKKNNNNTNKQLEWHETLFNDAENNISKLYFGDDNKYKSNWNDDEIFKVVYGSYIEELKYKIKQNDIKQEVKGNE